MENDFRILNVQIVNDICNISDLLDPSPGKLNDTENHMKTNYIINMRM